MPKTIEDDPRWPAWINRLLNRLSVDTDLIRSNAIAIGKWGTYRAFTHSKRWYDEAGNVVHDNQYQSNFFNGWWFRRTVYVRGTACGWSFQHRPRGKNYKHQLIIGYKVNGRLALTLRLWHTDASSERGTTGPNYGQAKLDEWGTA